MIAGGLTLIATLVLITAVVRMPIGADFRGLKTMPSDEVDEAVPTYLIHDPLLPSDPLVPRIDAVAREYLSQRHGLTDESYTLCYHERVPPTRSIYRQAGNPAHIYGVHFVMTSAQQTAASPDKTRSWFLYVDLERRRVLLELADQ